MTDIVERLRNLITHARDSGMKTETLEDAKREIERLRRTSGETRLVGHVREFDTAEELIAAHNCDHMERGK